MSQKIANYAELVLQTSMNLKKLENKGISTIETWLCGHVAIQENDLADTNATLPESE